MCGEGAVVLQHDRGSSQSRAFCRQTDNSTGSIRSFIPSRQEAPHGAVVFIKIYTSMPTQFGQFRRLQKQPAYAKTGTHHQSAA